MKIFLFVCILCFFEAQSLLSQAFIKTKSPYSTSWSKDGLIWGTSVIVAFSASAVDDKTPSLTLIEISALSKNNINPIDRITAGNYSFGQSKVSDLLVGVSIVSPFLLMTDEIIRTDIATIGTMYLETVMFATFTPSYGKGGVRRIRPYVYGAKAPLEQKLDPDARRSFFSGHATWAFATSVFFATVYSDYYPNSQFKEPIWYGSIGLASTISILRVTSGAHFISDIIVGAAVGSTIGYMIPYLHRNNSSDFTLSPQITPQYRGLSFSYHLK